MNKTKPLKCPVCGGEFSAEDLLDGDSIVTCLNCGNKYNVDDIFNKETVVKIEELKARSKRARLDHELELKKLKYAENKREEKTALIVIACCFGFILLIAIFSVIMAELGY